MPALESGHRHHRHASGDHDSRNAPGSSAFGQPWAHAGHNSFVGLITARAAHTRATMTQTVTRACSACFAVSVTACESVAHAVHAAEQCDTIPLLLAGRV